MRLTPAFILWHGLGDTFDRMKTVEDWIKELIPSAYTYSIRLSETPAEDSKASYFGLINSQIQSVCQVLGNNTNLQQEVHAIGLSQGGLFLRGLLQTCPSVQIKTLLTFGSPHAGVAEPPGCKVGDENCGMVARLIRSAVYWDWVQTKIVPAQYYKKFNDLPTYLQKSAFLADINNEKIVNGDYKRRISQLNRFIMVSFSEDEMIEPKESAWFYFYDKDGILKPIQETSVYQDLGLDKIRSRLVFDELPGRHLNISKKIVQKYIRDYMLSPLKSQ